MPSPKSFPGGISIIPRISISKTNITPDRMKTSLQLDPPPCASNWPKKKIAISNRPIGAGDNYLHSTTCPYTRQVAHRGISALRSITSIKIGKWHLQYQCTSCILARSSHSSPFCHWATKQSEKTLLPVLTTIQFTSTLPTPLPLDHHSPSSNKAEWWPMSNASYAQTSCRRPLCRQSPLQ